MPFFYAKKQTRWKPQIAVTLYDPKEYLSKKEKERIRLDIEQNRAYQWVRSIEDLNELLEKTIKKFVDKGYLLRFSCKKDDKKITIDVYIFSPIYQIKKIKWRGFEAEEIKKIQAILALEKGQRVAESLHLWEQKIKEGVVSYYQDRGYGDAKVILKIKKKKKKITLSLSLKKGTCYRWQETKIRGNQGIHAHEIKAELGWYSRNDPMLAMALYFLKKGNFHAFFVAIFRTFFKPLPPTEADREKARQKLLHWYRKKLGFLSATASISQSIDREKKTIAIEIRIDEGAQFSIGSLKKKMQGLPWLEEVVATMKWKKGVGFTQMAMEEACEKKTLKNTLHGLYNEKGMWLEEAKFFIEGIEEGKVNLRLTLKGMNKPIISEQIISGPFPEESLKALLKLYNLEIGQPFDEKNLIRLKHYLLTEAKLGGKVDIYPTAMGENQVALVLDIPKKATPYLSFSTAGFSLFNLEGAIEYLDHAPGLENFHLTPKGSGVSLIINWYKNIKEKSQLFLLKLSQKWVIIGEQIFSLVATLYHNNIARPPLSGQMFHLQDTQGGQIFIKKVGRHKGYLLQKSGGALWEKGHYQEKVGAVGSEKWVSKHYNRKEIEVKGELSNKNEDFFPHSGQYLACRFAIAPHFKAKKSYIRAQFEGEKFQGNPKGALVHHLGFGWLLKEDTSMPLGNFLAGRFVSNNLEQRSFGVPIFMKGYQENFIQGSGYGQYRMEGRYKISTKGYCFAFFECSIFFQKKNQLYKTYPCIGIGLRIGPLLIYFGWEKGSPSLYPKFYMKINPK